jgi:hypothetical protein
MCRIRVREHENSCGALMYGRRPNVVWKGSGVPAKAKWLISFACAGSAPDDLVLLLYGSYAAIFIRFILSKAVTNLPHFFMPSRFSGM